MNDRWTAPTRRGVMGLIAVTVAGGVMIPQRLFAQAAGGLISNADICLLVPEVTEGPYYFDPALVRTDITEGKEGLPLLLRMQVDLDIGATAFWYAVLLAVGATIIPSFLLAAALHRISAQANATIGMVSPVATIVLAWLILGETLNATDFLGVALVLAGVGAMTLRGGERPAAGEPRGAAN